MELRPPGKRAAQMELRHPGWEFNRPLARRRSRIYGRAPIRLMSELVRLRWNFALPKKIRLRWNVGVAGEGEFGGCEIVWGGWILRNPAILR